MGNQWQREAQANDYVEPEFREMNFRPINMMEYDFIPRSVFGLLRDWAEFIDSPIVDDDPISVSPAHSPMLDVIGEWNGSYLIKVVITPGLKGITDFEFKLWPPAPHLCLTLIIDDDGNAVIENVIVERREQ